MGYAAVPDEIKKMVTEGKLGAGTAMVIVKNISDEKKAIAIAKKVSEKPRGKEKKRYLDTAIDNPDLSPDEIDKEADKRKYTKVTIDLSDKVADALAKACDDTETDPESIAKEALVEWLESQGYF